MSWQTYVDEQLLCDIDGQRLTAAAILGHDGAVWAQSHARSSAPEATATAAADVTAAAIPHIIVDPLSPSALAAGWKGGRGVNAGGTLESLWRAEPCRR